LTQAKRQNQLVFFIEEVVPRENQSTDAVVEERVEIQVLGLAFNGSKYGMKENQKKVFLEKRHIMARGGGRLQEP
jgi:hypothetical protein